MNKVGGILKYADRPFDNIWEHDETQIDNWNSVVKDGDTVIMDGDVAYGSVKHIKGILSRLKGKKIVVLGDHDKQMWQCREFFEEITKYKTINVGKHFIVIFHWCIRAWQRSHYNSYHAFGHSHGRLPPIGKSWDVGVDTEYPEIGHKRFFPYHIDEFLKIMDLRPDNPNCIKNRR
jgi:calcineurin-like phosphoesterase family protein